MNDAKRKPGRPRVDPALKRRRVNFTMHPWISDWLRAQKRPASKLIEEALIGWFRIDPPK